MRKKKFAATAVALVMTAITVFSVGNTPSVKAADVADKSAIDLEINGSYEEKKISTADSDVINKAFGYDSGTNSVLVCVHMFLYIRYLPCNDCCKANIAVFLHILVNGFGFFP